MTKLVSSMTLMALLFGLWSPGVVNAALILRGVDTLGNGLIYDTDRDISWYDFSNSIGFWQEQIDWAGGLSIEFGGAVIDDWRLPITVDHESSVGENITTSEMGHLFYSELGGTASAPISSSGDPDLALFPNLQDEVYWSGSDFALNPGEAWAFTFRTGSQSHIIFNSRAQFTALAVRTGDVVTTPVPEPSTGLLMGMGVAWIVSCRRRTRLA